MAKYRLKPGTAVDWRAVPPYNGAAMRDMKLVLVEGLPGSGKTTTARWLVGALAGRGVGARLLREDAPEHPLKVGGPLHPGGTTTGAALFARYTVERYADESLARWASFAAAADDGVRVVEAFPWQNAARVLFQMDAPMERILEYAAAVEDLLAPRRPVLVYLERRDAVATFLETAAERGVGWTAPSVAIITDSPMARRHGLRGFDGALRFIALYKEFLDAVRAASRLPAVVLEDGAPWNVRYEAVRTFLGL
jgi:hypothetical protein